MACHIFYDTFYGSTREYAQALGQRLGVEPIVFDTPEAVAALPTITAAPGTPIVVLSPIHGPAHPGVRFIKQLPDDVVENHPIALATVGMMLIHVAVNQDAASNLLGALAERVTRFYLPGRMNYSELSPKHAAVMRGIVGALRLKPGKTANDRAMVANYGRDVDTMDLARLVAVADWAQQRENPAE